jgi:hypothetical protein
MWWEKIWVINLVMVIFAVVGAVLLVWLINMEYRHYKRHKERKLNKRINGFAEEKPRQTNVTNVQKFSFPRKTLILGSFLGYFEKKLTEFELTISQKIIDELAPEGKKEFQECLNKYTQLLKEASVEKKSEVRDAYLKDVKEIRSFWNTKIQDAIFRETMRFHRKIIKCHCCQEYGALYPETVYSGFETIMGYSGDEEFRPENYPLFFVSLYRDNKSSIIDSCSADVSGEQKRLSYSLYTNLVKCDVCEELYCSHHIHELSPKDQEKHEIIKICDKCAETYPFDLEERDNYPDDWSGEYSETVLLMVFEHGQRIFLSSPENNN